MNLQNKCAIVTGSTKGIGLAIAEVLVREGTHVVISARSEVEVASVVDRLNRKASTRVVGKSCDVQDAQQVEVLVNYCLSQLGGLDILINNAGLGIFKTVEQMTPAEWRQTLATNLDGLYYACHFAIPALRKAKEGFIVNIGSLAGKNAFPSGAAYNASKFGLVGFSEALMQEIRHDDIRVCYVMPGSVETSFAGNVSPGEQSWKLAASDVAEVVVQTLKRDSRCLTSRIEMRPSRPPQK